MRVAFSIVTLSVLIGCTAPYLADVPWGVTMSNSRAVVLTLGTTPRGKPGSIYRKIMLKRAQQECDQYGKDAVLDREEPAYSYTRYHYRCETREAE